MIRLEVTEEDAVSLHDVVQRLRRIAPDVADPLRGVELALAGGLRAAGWTPGGEQGTWEKRPVRGRR